MNMKAAHEALRQAAREQRTISYGEVISLADLRLTGDALSGELGRLFYDIVMAELAKDPDAPMLSAVALPKDGTRPGKGFFIFARDLGRLNSTDPDTEDAFWIKELNAAFAYWASLPME
jgi:hypothetical protein